MHVRLGNRKEKKTCEVSLRKETRPFVVYIPPCWVSKISDKGKKQKRHPSPCACSLIAWKLHAYVLFTGLPGVRETRHRNDNGGETRLSTAIVGACLVN